MGQLHRIEEAGLSTFTSVSLQYRQTAAGLGVRAHMEDDPVKVRAMLDLALAWIQLAENEELMASEYRSSENDF